MSKPLQWIDGPSYHLPAKSACGSYVVHLGAGGTRGPVFRSSFMAGVGVGAPIGPPRDTIPEAKADAQAHADEIGRQQQAAARNPSV